jgi:hypothetical protein
MNLFCPISLGFVGLCYLRQGAWLLRYLFLVLSIPRLELKLPRIHIKPIIRPKERLWYPRGFLGGKPVVIGEPLPESGVVQVHVWDFLLPGLIGIAWFLCSRKVRGDYLSTPLWYHEYGVLSTF